MQLRLFAVVAVVTVWGFSCAKSGGSGSGDEGSGGFTAASSGTKITTAGSGKSTSVTSASTGNPATRTDSSAQTTSSGMCMGTPCKLVAPQCGCMSGQGCTIDGMTDMPVCVPAGTATTQSACGAGN